MAKKLGPYIGVTGFMSRAEVTEALAMIPDESARRVMVGVLMSSKTLAGQTNKWPGRYPKKEAVADIFVDDPRALNLIHYNTDNPWQLAAEISQIVELAGPHLDGFQLNVTWPDPSQIQMIRDTFPDLYLLLQVGGKAIDFVESTKDFQDILEWYLPKIDSILIDPSGGKGLPLDVEKAAELLRAAQKFAPPRLGTLGLGVAGGLGPDMIYLIEPLIREFPGMSIDAEGRLRTPQPEDALDLTAMRRYILEAYLFFDRQYVKGIR